MSTRTPSQSKRRADGRGEEEFEQVIPEAEFDPLHIGLGLVVSMLIMLVPKSEDDKVLSWGLRLAMEEAFG